MTGLNTRKQLAGALVLAIAAATVVAAQSRKAPPQVLDRTAAMSAFERIKNLSGTWQSKSTKGWEERQEFSLIAKGTAVATQSMPMPSANASKDEAGPN